MGTNRVFFPQEAVDRWLDVAELVGKVKTVVYLSALGAELLGDSMVLSDSAHRVLPGWLGAPSGTLAQHRALREEQRVSRRPPPAHGSDEELLADFLARNL